MKKIIKLVFLIIAINNATMAQENGNYASVNGLRLYYEIHGKGEPLVLIHGGGSTINTSFGRVLPSFAKNHRVIAVELQAHGHTADIDRDLSFEQDADDVSALLKQLRIDKADFFGFSNGASTTLQIAIRHPNLVNKLIVASTMYKKDGAYPWLWESMKNASFDNMPKVLKDEYLKINPDPKALYRMYERDVTRMQTFRDIKEEDIRNIQSPVLILIGDADVVRPEHAVEMFRQLPKAKLMILPGGHGDYIGEISSLKSGTAKQYPAVQLIEEFLTTPFIKQ